MRAGPSRVVSLTKAQQQQIPRRLKSSLAPFLRQGKRDDNVKDSGRFQGRSKVPG